MITRWISGLVFAALLSQAPLSAQQSPEDYEMMLEMSAKGLKNPQLPMENPTAVDSGAKGGIRFYLTSLMPSGNLDLFVREGEEHLPIRAAYDTFGSLHRISLRPELVLCEKVVRKVEGKEETIYQPRFSAAVPQGASPFLAVLQPMGKVIEGKAYPLRVFSLSPAQCPFGKVTLLNPFSDPIQVTIDQSQKLIPANQSYQHAFKILRDGAGYVRIRVDRKTAAGEGQNLFETRIAMFEASRGICLPYLDSGGSGSLGLLVHRESPPEVQLAP